MGVFGSIILGAFGSIPDETLESPKGRSAKYLACSATKPAETEPKQDRRARTGTNAHGLQPERAEPDGTTKIRPEFALSLTSQKTLCFHLQKYKQNRPFIDSSACLHFRPHFLYRKHIWQVPWRSQRAPGETNGDGTETIKVINGLFLSDIDWIPLFRRHP